MKANELRPCDLCGKGLLHTGLPLFYRVTFERMAVDLAAVRERVALGMLFNRSARSNAVDNGAGTLNASRAEALAEVFASTSEIARRLGAEPDELLVCESCSLAFDSPTVIAELAERAAHRRISAQARDEEQAEAIHCADVGGEVARGLEP